MIKSKTINKVQSTEYGNEKIVNNIDNDKYSLEEAQDIFDEVDRLEREEDYHSGMGIS